MKQMKEFLDKHSDLCFRIKIASPIYGEAETYVTEVQKKDGSEKAFCNVNGDILNRLFENSIGALIETAELILKS